MRKFIIAIMCGLGIAAAYAENENAATSKEYVDTEIATKQPTVPAVNTNTVMTYDSTATNGIGTKNIYDPSGSYAAQQNALVTTATANAAIQTGINREFVCVGTDPNDDTDCWFWQVKSDTVPSGYTKLEYLQSDGTQYIDTEIAPNNKTGIKGKFNKNVGGDQVVIGTSGTTETNFYLNQAASKFYLPFGDVWNNSNCGSQSIYIDYEVSMNYMNDRKRYVNGESKLDITTTLVGQSSSMYLFAGHRTDIGAGYFFKGKIYYMQITNGIALVRNFIPAKRNSDGVLGMYDTVTDRFFTNAGSGTFIAGPVASYLPQNVQ